MWYFRTEWKPGKPDLSEKDAQAYYDEMLYMVVMQYVAPNSPQWFNTGLHWAYGITGSKQGHYFVNPDTQEVEKSTDAYTRPQPHACFIQSVSDAPSGLQRLNINRLQARATS